MEIFTRRTIKKTGRYYFKTEKSWIESNDPEVIKKLEQSITFDQIASNIDTWAKSILKENGVPNSLVMYRTKAGGWTPDEQQSENYGWCKLCHYVTEELGYDEGSVPGIAARLVSTIGWIKLNGKASELDAFEIGRLAERLEASLYLDDGSRKGVKKIAAKKEDKKQRTIEAFYKVEKRDKLSWAALTREIEKRWISTGPKDQAPGVDAVKRYIRSENLKN